VKRFVVDAAMKAGGKVCPPVIMGVGVGGTSDLCMHLAKVAATRRSAAPARTRKGRAGDRAVGRGEQPRHRAAGAWRGTAPPLPCHVEVAATHITMNPVAVNIQCHSARRASATFTPDGVAIGF
jgi:fumarate hydratase subunit alpha/L(+)-tartrate dehydratase alpha subunit